MFPPTQERKAELVLRTAGGARYPNVNDALTLFNNLLHQTKYRIWAPTMTIGNPQSDAARFGTRPNMLFVGAGVLVFALIFMASRQFDSQQSQLHAMSSHVTAAELSDQLADAIENEINKNLVAVQALAAYQKTHDSFTQQEFLDFASEVEAGGNGILSLQLAPGGVVSYLTQPESNAQAVGHNLLKDTRRSRAALQSIETGQFTIVGPVDLLQGGKGLIARKPLYDEGADGAKLFWRFAVIVLDFGSLTNLLPRAHEDSRHLFAMRNLSHEPVQNGVIWGDPNLFELDPHLTTVQLAAGTWELATYPIHGWPTKWPFATHFRIATTAIAIILAIFSVILLHKPAQLRRAIKIATTDLLQTEEKLRKAQRIAKIGSWYSNAQKDFFCSPETCQMLDLKPNEPAVQFDDLNKGIHLEDRARVRAIITTAINTHSDFECTFRFKKVDGTQSIFKLNGEVEQNPGNDDQIYAGTLQDISVQAMNEERLRQAQKMEAIGQLTGGIAHDFNNLLTVILGNAELLQLTLDHDQDLLTEIQSATLRGSALTHRLLAYARKQPLTPKSTNLKALIRNMDGILSRTIGEHIDVMTEFQDDLWRAKVDSGQIEDAVLNLALNARDAMPKGGSLLIECENIVVSDTVGPRGVNLDNGRFVNISVTDTGCGMSEEVKSRASEPFFTTKGVGEGSGLGLSMICGFTMQSGGGMSIDSQLGQGTTVKLYLPYDDTTDEKIEQPTPRVEAPQGHGEHVLVVEDNTVVGRVLTRTLKGLGYQTLEVANISDAKKMLQTRDDIALVLTDVVLPDGESGLDLVAALEKSDNPSQIIIMSGYPLITDQTSNDILARHTLISKPFSRDLLAQSLRDKLGASSQYRTNDISALGMLHAFETSLDKPI